MQLRFWREELRLIHPWSISYGTDLETVTVLLVELAASDGTVGLGEASPARRYNESPEAAEAFLRKVDAQKLSPDDLEASLTYLDSIGPGNLSAKGAINVALLDCAARYVQKPLHDFLGLGFRERHHVTSFSIGLDAPDVIREKVRAAEKMPVLKLKLGSKTDMENLRALRDAAPLKPVRVDANEAWRTKEEALAMIEWLANDGHIQFVEQPLPATAPAEDWRWLKARSPMPIFADESFHTAADAGRLVECVHGVNVKLCKTGGVSRALDALRAARTAGLKTMIGCMIETSVLISAAAHLSELADYLDLDGNLLITNDPFLGIGAEDGFLSFAKAPLPFGLRAARRPELNHCR